MFAGGPERCAALVVEQLLAFALTDGVVAEHDEAMLREQAIGLLIRHPGLAVDGVTARMQHGGKRPLARGPVDIRRYMKSRPAFEEHLFDREPILAQHSGDARIQRRALGHLT